METKSLYKLDSKGKTRVLNYWTEGSFICQSSGVLNGALTENKKEAKGKNIGKANETTPKEQAILEVESKIREKINEGYCETIEECKASTLILPMLAKNFKETKNEDIDWSNAYGQRKFDGQRILATKKQGEVTLMSRGGKQILTLDHIREQILNSNMPDGIYDGEAYCLELGSFQQQIKAIKKVGPNTRSIKFNVYDVVLGVPFDSRFFHLEGVFANLGKGYDALVLTETIKVASRFQLDELHKKFMAEGFEGTMLRIANKPYEPDARSTQLLKYKDFIDIQLTILDVIPQDSRPKQGQFIFTWLGAKGHFMGDGILGCGMKFSHEERKEFLINKANYIGQKVELRFFEYSEEGVPRFPVAVAIL